MIMGLNFIWWSFFFFWWPLFDLILWLHLVSCCFVWWWRSLLSLIVVSVSSFLSGLSLLYRGNLFVCGVSCDIVVNVLWWKIGGLMVECLFGLDFPRALNRSQVTISLIRLLRVSWPLHWVLHLTFLLSHLQGFFQTCRSRAERSYTGPTYASRSLPCIILSRLFSEMFLHLVG